MNPYLLIQKHRLGLRKEDIHRARALLDRPWEDAVTRTEQLLKDHYEVGESEPLQWLKSQPILERSDLRSRIETKGQEIGSGFEYRRTSGSSGDPLRFYRSKEVSRWMEATALALYEWHGQKPWRRQARFWGGARSSLGAARQQIRDRILGRRRFNAFSVTDDACREFFKSMVRFRPTHAYGYPSLMAEFADRCRALGLDGPDLGLELVISTGEPLFPGVRAKLADFFQCRVVNEYGCTESGILGFECEYGTMHTIPMVTWVETLDEKTGEVITESPGVVVLTDLLESHSPFLRYRLGDRATIKMLPGCGCGRELPCLSIESGRLKSFIRLPGGKKVNDGILAYSVPDGVLKYRGRQPSPSKLEVEVVLRPDADPSGTLAIFQHRLDETLGGEMDIQMVQVPEIEREESGKLRYFIPYDGNLK